MLAFDWVEVLYNEIYFHSRTIILLLLWSYLNLILVIAIFYINNWKRVVSHNFCFAKQSISVLLTVILQNGLLHIFHSANILVILFLESYLEFCVHVCEWLQMTKRMLFHTIWNAIISLWMDLNYWIKLSSYTLIWWIQLKHFGFW